MSVIVDKWETKTLGNTIGEMSAYAEKGSYSVVFREDGHKKVVYQFHTLADLSDAVIALKRGWLSAARGK